MIKLKNGIVKRSINRSDSIKRTAVVGESRIDAVEAGVRVGALYFALSKGFEKENLLTKKSKKNREEWLKKLRYHPIIDIENHDTIGLLILDNHSNLFGAFTTDGIAWKTHRRGGDSPPIIGLGLFSDNDVGAEVAIGSGDAVIRTSGSAMVGKQMRLCKSPTEACKEIVNLIRKKHRNSKDKDYFFSCKHRWRLRCL